MKTIIASLLLAVSASAFAAPVNLIQNGSFEKNSVSNNSWAVLPSLDNWTLGSQGMEVRNNVAGSAQEGRNFLELDTYQNSWLSQDVATVAGGKYDLSFFYAARPGTGANTNGIDVFWNGSLLKHVALDNYTGNNQWLKFDLSMLATGGVSKLEFRAVGNSDGYGGSLDNVSLVSVVPEPGTLAIFGLGLGMLGFSLRRRAK